MASYKNMTCNYWARGDCRYTEAECRYAHSWTDLTSNERYVPQGARTASVSVSALRPIPQPTPTSTASSLAGPRFQAFVPATRAMHQSAATSTTSGLAGASTQPFVPATRTIYQPAATTSTASALPGSDSQAFVPMSRIMHRPAATSTASGLAGASSQAFVPFSRPMHQSAVTSTASHLARPSFSATASTTTSDDGHGVALYPSSGKVKGLARQPPPTKQPENDRRLPLNPYAPTFEPLRANRHALYINPNAARSDPVLEAPTNFVNVPAEVKDKVSQILNERPELSNMAADMRKFVREMQSGEQSRWQSGRASAQPIEQAYNIKLTEYATYIEWLVSMMNEASVAWAQSDEGKPR